jgi:hypothetical protein
MAWERNIVIKSKEEIAIMREAGGSMPGISCCARADPPGHRPAIWMQPLKR